MRRVSLVILSIAIFYLLPANAEEPPHGMTQPLPKPITAKPRLGDRFFMKSVLSHVFGPAADQIIRENIFYNGTVFGGPCDEYEQIRTGKESPKQLVDPDTYCPGDKIGTRLTQVPEENVIRIGYLAKACGELVAKRETLVFAVMKVGNLEQSPASAEYFKVIKLFNPTESISSKDTEFFSKLESDEKFRRLSPEDRWRLLLKMTCTSSDWQIL